ncbi:hypothetical protein FRB90_005019 [Tulasnella sp. 427]|nr:hypothetical protein FRB90_005019 [Tulasnella sp. 427]
MNILVNDSFDAVITDFGSARLVDKPQSSSTLANEAIDAQQVARLQVKFRADTNELTLSGAQISLRWAAPEVLDEATPDLPSDMWAFGWICWEFITGKIPFPDEKNAWAIIPKVVRHQMPALRDDARLSYVISLCSVMTDCWSLDVPKRPSAEQCERELHCIPNAVPSAPSSTGNKHRSSQHLSGLAFMYMLQSEYQAVETLLNEALDLARSTENYDSACTFLDSLVRYQKARGDFNTAKRYASLLSSMSAQHGFNAVENSVPAIEGLFSFALQDFREPVEILDHTRSTLDTLDDPRRAVTLVVLAYAYLVQSNFDLAMGSLTQALEIFTGEHLFLGVGIVLNIMAFIHGMQGREQTMDKLLQHSADVATRTNAGQQVQGHGLFFIGVVRFSQERFSEAEESLMLANDIFSISSDHLGQVVASTLLGDVYSSQNNYLKAVESYLQASSIAAQVGIASLEAAALISLGEVLDKQIKPSEAEEAFSRALTVSKEIRNHASRGFAMSRLAVDLNVRGEPGKAEMVFVDAAAAYHIAGDEYEEGPVLLGLAVVQATQSDREGATKSCQKALDIYTRLEFDPGRAQALLYLGLLSVSRDEAVVLMSEARDSYARMGDTEGEALTVELLAMLDGGIVGRLTLLFRPTTVKVLGLSSKATLVRSDDGVNSIGFSGVALLFVSGRDYPEHAAVGSAFDSYAGAVVTVIESHIFEDVGNHTRNSRGGGCNKAENWRDSYQLATLEQIPPVSAPMCLDQSDLLANAEYTGSGEAGGRRAVVTASPVYKSPDHNTPNDSHWQFVASSYHTKSTTEHDEDFGVDDWASSQRNIGQWFVRLTKWAEMATDMERFIPKTYQAPSSSLQIDARYTAAAVEPQRQASSFETIKSVPSNRDMAHRIAAIRDAAAAKVGSSKALSILQQITSDDDPAEWQNAFEGSTHREAQLLLGQAEHVSQHYALLRSAPR